MAAAGHEVRGSDTARLPADERAAGPARRAGVAAVRGQQPRLGARRGRGRQRPRQGSRRGGRGHRARGPAHVVPGAAGRDLPRRAPRDGRSPAPTARPPPHRWSPTSSRPPGAIPACSSAACRSRWAPAIGSARGPTSSSRATSTTPPSSTRAPSSCTTAPRPRCSPRSSSITSTSSRRSRRCATRSASSSALMPPDRPAGRLRRVPRGGGDRRRARGCTVERYVVLDDGADAPPAGTTWWATAPGVRQDRPAGVRRVPR
jgi:hypothetical protein